jgi:hypothetical protein
MKIRDISVCMASPEGDKGVFDFARAFATARQAHLSCAALTILPQVFVGYGDFGSGAAYASVLQETRASLAAAWEKFEEEVGRDTPAVEMRRFQTLTSGVETISAINARHTDLVIVGAAESSGDQPHADMLEGVLLGGGRPVLMVPQAWKNTTIGQRTIVAWDSSREATRALHDGLLLMPEGANVCVTTVDAKPGEDGHGAGPGWDIGAHISRHGHKVEIRNEDSVGRSAGQALLDVAIAFDADLIVMGGYRHARLQQALLPGVTRTVLRAAKVPVLLSH